MHLSPIQEAPDDTNRTRYTRPAKLISPKNFLTNQSSPTPSSLTYQGGKLSSKNISPSKKTAFSALTLPTTKRGNLSIDNKKLGNSVSASTIKGKTEITFSRDFANIDSEFLPAINKQGTSQSKSMTPQLRESNKSLSDNGEMIARNMGKYLNANLLPSENDWTAINGSDNVDEEMAKVRMLDAWQFEMMKDKVSGTLGNSHDLTSLYKKQKPSTQDNHDFPRVNVKLIQGILANPEEKASELLRFSVYNTIEYKKGVSSIMTDSMTTQTHTKKLEFGSDAMQSLENAIRENNQEILYELIQKKIKDFFYKTDIDSMTREQLKVHTKMIAESVIDQFKSLKGATNLVLIQNRIDFIISRLRHSKHTKSSDSPGFLNNGPEKKVKVVVDYKSIESAFIRNYQQSLQNIKDYRDHIKILNKKSYKLRNQLKPFLKELEELGDGAEQTERVNSGNNGTNPKKTRRKSGEFNLNEIVSDAIKMEQENAANSVEFIRVQKLKQEKKKARIEVQNKIKDLQEQIAKVTNEIELSEKELKSSRNFKIHYRIQLKDLYYKMLKDETSLVDINNTLSYSWVVRALWKMNEEVPPHSFPAFLDQTSISFLINYAKLQDQLEKHCKHYNLMFLISSSDDFKDNNAIEFSNSKNGEDDNASPGVSAFNINGETSAGLSEKKSKDFHTLLDQFKNKMHSLKKVNLKAKKLTQVTHYNTKGKYMTSKWEDVDPHANTNILDNSLDETENEISRYNGGERSSAIDTSNFKDSPLDKALEIMENLKNMREEEISRIISQFLARDLDEKQKLNMKKIFRFLFARKEGEKAFYQCLKEKMSHDQKNLRKISATHQKAALEAESMSPYKLVGTVSYAENQIWNTGTPFSGNELGIASPKNFGKNSFGAGDSVFKAAAARVLG